MESIKKTGLLKRYKVAGSDTLSPCFFKDDGEVVTSSFTKLLRSVWTTEQIPKDWCESVIIAIYKKSDTSSCENHTEIILVGTASKLLASVIFRRFPSAHKTCICENQTGFRRDRGCICYVVGLAQLWRLTICRTSAPEVG